jgi:hypothetical protein
VQGVPTTTDLAKRRERPRLEVQEDRLARLLPQFGEQFGLGRGQSRAKLGIRRSSWSVNPEPVPDG